MKTIKKWMLLVLSILMMTSLAAGLIACGKHEHSYTAEVIAPTCTEAGYTKHTCDCGESYTDTEVPAIGHDYNTKVIKYPSVTEAGEKKHTCSICNNVKTETIDALTVSMPRISDVLVDVIGAFSAKIAIDEGSTFVFNSNFEDQYYNSVIEVELGEAVVSTQDGELVGHLKLDVKETYEANGKESGEGVASIYAYVNGDAVSFEIDYAGEKEEGEFDGSKELYTMLAETMGLSYDQFVTLLNVGKEAAGYIPSLMNLIESEMPTISKDYVDGAKQLFETFGQEIIVETEEEGNTVYTVNVEALGLFLEEIEGETIATYVDKVFGKGSTEAIKSFVVSLPEKTVKEIATGAISIAKTYDIDVNNVYYLVNLVARSMGEQDFDIEALIENQYDKTFAQLISAGEIPVAELKEGLAQQFDGMVNLNVDQLYAMITGDEEASLIEQINEYIETFAEIITAEIVFDAQGAFVSANLVSPFVEISIANGEYKLVYSIGSAMASFVADANGIAFAVEEAGNEYVNFEFNLENGLPASTSLALGGWGGYYEDYYNEELDEWDYVFIRTEFETKAEFITEFTFEENGFMTAIDGEIFGWGYEYDEDEGETRVYRKQSTIEYKATADVDGSVETINFVATSWMSHIKDYVKVLDIAYADNDGATSIDMIVEDAIINIDKEITETSEMWIINGYTAGYGEEDDLLVMNGTFGYMTYEGRVTYIADLKVNLEEGFKDVLDLNMIVEDGQITSLTYRAGGAKLPNGTIYSSDYETEYVIERFIIPSVGIIYDSEEKILSYNFSVDTYENTTIEVWDEDYGYWVVVDQTEELTGSSSISIAVEETEDGVILNVNGIEVAIDALENGVELSINEEGFAEGVVTITLDGSALNIDYDIEGIYLNPIDTISGVGGITISIS